MAGRAAGGAGQGEAVDPPVGGAPEPSATALDVDSVLEEARRRTGLDAFGDPWFVEPLRVLLRSLDEEARLTPVGRATQRARVVESLMARLRAEDAFRRHPEILEERVGDPVVIVGLARTGTTRLHRLLASGGGFQAACWWEVRFPSPFAHADAVGPDPRIAAAREEVRRTLEAVPVLASIHPWDAEAPDEEIMLLEHSFCSHVPESGADVPGYRSWLDQQDLRPAYRELDRWLRYLQWQHRRSGRGTGRWLLKAPFHLGYVDALVDVFPGARFVQTHRDPLETIPSAASLYRALWQLNREDVDAHEVGRQVCERYAWALDRCMASRDRLAADRFLDVAYHDVERDDLAQVRRVHHWLGVPLDAGAEAAMRAWSAAHAREHRAPHRYRLEEFGYDAAGLARRFARYRERFLRAGIAGQDAGAAP